MRGRQGQPPVPLKPNRRLFAALLLAAACLPAVPAAAGEALERIRAAGVLTVATDSNWAPQSFLNDDNEMDGFDVDVAREIAARLGVAAAFVTPQWEVVTAGRWAGRWDISVGSMTPTRERAQVLDFPAIYHYASVGFAVHEDSSARTKADLNGKRIGACTACTPELYLLKALNIAAENAPPVTYEVTAGEIVSMQEPAALFDDLRLGDGVRLDAVIDSRAALEDAVAAGYPFRIVGTAFNEPLAIAIDKGDPELHALLAQTVGDMRAEGVLSRLSRKWYGRDRSSAAD